MVKVFISQPMKDKTNDQILAERQRAKEEVAKILKDDEVTIIESFFQDAPHDAKPLWFLGKSIQLLSTADVAYFVGNWRDYRGCKAENYLCKEYGIKTIEEQEEFK